MHDGSSGSDHCVLKMSGNIASSSATLPYAKRVESEYPGEKYSCFVDMLEGRVLEKAVPQFQEPASIVRIVDKLNSISEPKPKIFDAAKGTDVCQNFLDILSEQMVNLEARLVVVNYTRIQNLNFKYIEAIGSILNIDPIFFIIHLERARAKYENPFRYRAPSRLPLESGYLQFS